MHEYDRDGVARCIVLTSGRRHQGRGGLALASAGAQRGGRAAVAGLLLRCGGAFGGGKRGDNPAPRQGTCQAPWNPLLNS